MLKHRVGVLPCGQRMVKPCWHLLPIAQIGQRAFFLLLLASFPQLICCNVIAVNSNKAASPGSYEAKIACEGHTTFLPFFFFFLVCNHKSFIFFIQTSLQVVTFLSALYNSVTFWLSVRGRSGMEESSWWITLGLTFTGRWGESMRPLRAVKGRQHGNLHNIIN